MKDIYSPLEIDEQWDQRAPMVDGEPEGGAAAAVAIPQLETTVGVSDEDEDYDEANDGQGVEEPQPATSAAGGEVPPPPPLDPPEDGNGIDPTVANDKENVVEPSESFKDMTDTPPPVTDPNVFTGSKDVPKPPEDPIDAMSQRAAAEAMGTTPQPRSTTLESATWVEGDNANETTDRPEIVKPTADNRPMDEIRTHVEDKDATSPPLEAGDFHQEFGDTETSTTTEPHADGDALERVDSELQEALDTLEAEDVRVEQELERLNGEIRERQTNINLLEARRDKTRDRIKTLRAMLNGPVPEDSGK